MFPKEIANLTCTWKSWWQRLWKRCKGFANTFKLVTLSNYSAQEITRSEMWQIHQMMGSDDQTQSMSVMQTRTWECD